MKNLKFIALDTNIFVYYFNLHPKFGQPSKIIFDKLGSSKIKAVTSITTLIELLSSKMLSVQDAKEMTTDFYNIPNLTICDVNNLIAQRAASIRRQYGFRTPDAIQLATALKVGVKAFITNDHRLKSFKKIKIIMVDEVE